MPKPVWRDVAPVFFLIRPLEKTFLEKKTFLLSFYQGENREKVGARYFFKIIELSPAGR